jgi:hypothetical protein
LAALRAKVEDERAARVAQAKLAVLRFGRSHVLQHDLDALVARAEEEVVRLQHRLAFDGAPAAQHPAFGFLAHAGMKAGPRRNVPGRAK